MADVKAEGGGEEEQDERARMGILFGRFDMCGHHGEASLVTFCHVPFDVIRLATDNRKTKKKQIRKSKQKIVDPLSLLSLFLYRTDNNTNNINRQRLFS